MIENNTSIANAQSKRLEIKTQLQQLRISAVQGAGLTPWGAQALVDIVDEMFFTDADYFTFRSGQMSYSRVQSSAPAGKPLDKCAMITVGFGWFG